MTKLIRHVATSQMLRWFAYDHLPPRLQAISQPIHALAHQMADTVPDGPELTAGLRKLLEAKDCLMRAAIAPTMTDPRSGGTQ